jgi:outer membrane lipoprotein-sorting protein
VLFRPRLPLAAALACSLLAACDEPKPTPSVTTSGAASVTGSSVPAVPASASSEPAPSATAPIASAALPTADPTSVHSAAPPAPTARPTASAKATPAPKPKAGKDAGASDAGTVAVSDAGAANPALTLAQKIDAIFASKNTFSARFKQQYTLKATGAVKDDHGTVMMERPNKISFRYDPPNKKRIVSDGATIKIYTPEDSTMYEMPAQKTQYPGALAFMLGNGIASSFDFAINQRVNWPAGTVLDGKPKTENPSYETVMFYVDEKLLGASDPNAMKRVLILDAQGNKNRFDFESITQPPSIPASEFTFTPPPGTEIKK